MCHQGARKPARVASYKSRSATHDHVRSEQPRYLVPHPTSPPRHFLAAAPSSSFRPPESWGGARSAVCFRQQQQGRLERRRFPARLARKIRTRLLLVEPPEILARRSGSPRRLERGWWASAWEAGESSRTSGRPTDPSPCCSEKRIIISVSFRNRRS